MSKSLINTAKNKIKNWLYEEPDLLKIERDITELTNEIAFYHTFVKKYKEFDKSGKNYKSRESLLSTIRRTYAQLQKSKNQQDKNYGKAIEHAYKRKKGYVSPPKPPKIKSDIWDYLSDCLPEPLVFAKHIFLNGIYIDADYSDLPNFDKTMLWSKRLTKLLIQFEKDCKNRNWDKYLKNLYRVTLEYIYTDNAGNKNNAFISTKALPIYPSVKNNVIIEDIASALSKCIQSLINITEHTDFDGITDITSPKIEDMDSSNAEIEKIIKVKIDCYLIQQGVNILASGNQL